MYGNDAGPVTFWRAKCKLTGRELKFRTAFPPPATFEAMAAWVGRFWRNLELLEYAPWDEAMHGGGMLYPVPVQHVKFDVKTPDLFAPERNRVPVLISKPLGGASLFSHGRILGGKSLI